MGIRTIKLPSLTNISVSVFTQLASKMRGGENAEKSIFEWSPGDPVSVYGRSFQVVWGFAVQTVAIFQALNSCQ